MESSNRNGYFAFKMQQAREAYDEARGLLEDNAELRYVMNSLYYAYYYPVLALLQAAGSGAAMQSVSIALFERRFSGSGIIDYRFFPSIRKAFELKPKCTDTGPPLRCCSRMRRIFTMPWKQQGSVLQHLEGQLFTV